MPKNTVSLENLFNIPDSNQKLKLPDLSIPSRLGRTGQPFVPPGIVDQFQPVFETAVPESTARPLLPATSGEVDATTGASRPTDEVPLAPGITAPGGKQVAPTPEKGLGNERINALLNATVNPIEGVKRIKLPDGTEVEGITPADIQQTIGNANKEISANNTRPESAGDFLSGSPTFSFIAGKLAQAVAPHSPGIQAAGQIGIDLARNQVAGEYAKAIRTGEGLDNPRFNILSQEEKQKAVDALLAERRQTALEDVYDAQAQQARAAAAGTLTREEKLNNEAIDRATKLKLAEISDNNYMNIGQGYVFNIETGDVIKAYDYQKGGTGEGNVKSADYNQFLQLTASTYLPKAIANARADFIAKNGEAAAKLKDFTEGFREQDGSINFQRVMQNLSSEERVQFAQSLGQYASAVAQGVDRTTVFQAQEKEKAMDAFLQEIQQNGTATFGGQTFEFKNGVILPVKGAK